MFWVSEDMYKHRRADSDIPPDLLAGLPASQQATIVKAIGEISDAGYRADRVATPFEGLRAKTNGQFPAILQCIDALINDTGMLMDQDDKHAALRKAYACILQLERIYTDIKPDEANRLTEQLLSFEDDADSLMARVHEISSGRDDSDQGIPFRSGSSGVERGSSSKRNASRRVKKIPI